MKTHHNPAPGNFKFILIVPLIFFLLFVSSNSFAQPDLMVRDCFADEQSPGIEPSSCATPIYTSDGIKVTREADPDFTPIPFATGTLDNIWSSIGDEDAEYRNPTVYSKPNWIYVKVSNVGADTSDGTDTLKVYLAKGSTGLTWPLMWDDYLAIPGGCPNTLLLGEELTKTRKNLAGTNMLGERNKLLHAILSMDNIAYLDLVSWWDKQDEIHEVTHNHCGPSFMPWHRELLKRYELLLRASDPTNSNAALNTSTLKLHYWDWTTDPRTFNGVNMFDPAFMGTDCGGVTVPFSPSFSTDGQIFRFVNSCSAGAPAVQSDNTVITTGNGFGQVAQFSSFRSNLETNHNTVHGYIGGSIGDPHTSFEDPFVYFLHSDVDRLFARWQRYQDGNNTHLWRLNTPLSNTINGVYGNEFNSVKIFNAGDPCCGTCFGFAPINGIQTELEPWNGVACIDFCTMTPPADIFPWNTAGGHVLVKNSTDPSVVSAPFYDDAPLTIPRVPPGESVILEIPWYPLYPHDYAPCFNDSNHFCILARIVPGITTTEGPDVGSNTYWNNNIAWKNIQVYDAFPGSQLIACVIVRNMQAERAKIRLQINNQEQGELSYFKHGALILRLHDKLYTHWSEGGKIGGGFKDLGEGKIQLLNEKAWIGNMLMDKEEQYEVCLEFKVLTVPATVGAFHVNLEQLDDKGYLGGEQFKLKYNDGGRQAKPVASANNPIGEYTVSPNPMQSVFSIAANNNSTENSAYIYDVLGQMVYSEKFNGKTNINVDHFQHGIYMLKIVNENSKREFFQKIVKN